jgi:hypothetical protein
MTTTTRTEKLDLTRLRPDAFKAGLEAAIVTLEPAYYLVLNGCGNPNQPAGDFQEAIRALYSVAYPLKMRYKALGMDYKMPPLEALWWAYGNFGDKPRDITHITDDWRWRLMIMVPDYVTRMDVETSKAKQLEKKGLTAIEQIDLELVDEGLCVQVLHVGPYAEEPGAIKAMRVTMRDAGLRACGLHHEIYFNDPVRTAPEKLRTLLRQPVRREEDGCEAEDLFSSAVEGRSGRLLLSYKLVGASSCTVTNLGTPKLRD